MKKNLLFFLLLVLLSTVFSLSAQESKMNIATDYLLETPNHLGLTTDDIKNLKVNYEYKTDHNNLTHLYLVQTHNDIELYNGIINFNILPSNEVLYVGNNGVADLKSRINTSVPSITPSDAILKAIQHLNMDSKMTPKLLNKINDKEFLFEKGDVSYEDIKVKLKYQLLTDGKARLVWDIEIDQINGFNYWSMRIDALDGKLLDKNSFTSHDQFADNPYMRVSSGDCDEVPAPNKSKAEVFEATSAAGESYNVFAWPTESPLHGPQTIVTNPADAIASPAGWHDANGIKYQITRGNNVWAYADWEGTNASKNNEPNGGPGLLFDFPYSTTLEADLQINPAVVNLFYNNNMMHDFGFKYGFNEIAGNFQSKNYSNLGAGNDNVRAEAQDGFKASQPTLNNANFATPADGGAGRMQMFAWNTTGNRAVKVNNPVEIEGEYDNGTADYGSPLTANPVTGVLEVVEDNTSNPTWGCSTLKNTTLTGKIALVDRGSCNFSVKTYNAQLKGAIAVIICNFEEAIVNMTGGTNAAKCTIPSVFMKNNDCNRIRAFINKGVNVTLQVKAATGPVYLDGDFDNGIITHEYGHGISTRLTGGPANSGCLSNAEQMGEGWSDFMSLVTSVKVGDTKNTKRGVGNYVEKKTVDGVGIRTYPYSVDMSINPLTYDRTIQNPEVHATGEIWCQTIWDMYWAFSDKYGWSANLRDTSSGNGKAIKLVFDGMKIQKCSPGFLDGRDAILAADKADFGGVNNCMIWEVFARRGQGYFASQGSSESATDGKEDFSPNPYCNLKLKVEKAVTELIKPGDEIDVIIKVINHKNVTLNNVSVSDDIPTGATFVSGSANITPSVVGNKVNFSIPTLKAIDTITITYKLKSSATNKSTAFFYDDAEDSNSPLWDIIPIKGSNTFDYTDAYVNSGKQSLYVPYLSTDAATDQLIQLSNFLNVKGSNPVLGFYHYYNSEPGSDGGIVQYTTDDKQWNDLGSKTIKNGYRGPLTYSTFAIPNQKGFWGVSAATKGVFKPSFLDLSDLKGKNIKLRYRFGTDSLIGAKEGFLGWFIDDVIAFDMFNYISTVRVSASATDTASAIPIDKGTIVLPDFKVNTYDPKDGMRVNVFPNPTHELINVKIEGSTSNSTEISVFSIDGKQIENQKHNLSNGFGLIPIDISRYNDGMYFIKIQTPLGVVIEKIVKQ